MLRASNKKSTSSRNKFIDEVHFVVEKIDMMHSLVQALGSTNDKNTNLSAVFLIKGITDPFFDNLRGYPKQMEQGTATSTALTTFHGLFSSQWGSRLFDSNKKDITIGELVKDLDESIIYVDMFRHKMLDVFQLSAETDRLKLALRSVMPLLVEISSREDIKAQCEKELDLMYELLASRNDVVRTVYVQLRGFLYRAVENSHDELLFVPVESNLEHPLLHISELDREEISMVYTLLEEEGEKNLKEEAEKNSGDINQS